MCLLVNVSSHGPRQLRLTQPIDLEAVIRRLQDDTSIRIDAFEFGDETITLTNSGRYEIAVKPVQTPSLTSYVATMTSTDMSLHEAEIWSNAEVLSTLAKRTGQMKDAETALGRWKHIGYTAGMIRAQLSVGDIAFSSGDLALAGATYEAAREICQSEQDVRCIAEASNNSGMVARRLGDVETSSARLQEAAKNWNLLSEPVYAGRTLSNLGLLQWQSGDYQGALSSYSEATRLLKTRDRTSYGRVLNNLGLAYISLAEYGRAAAVLGAAIVEHARPALRKEMSVVRGNLGWAYLREGRVALAKRTLETALAEAIRANNRLAELSARANLGEAYRRSQRHAQSRVQLEKALELSRAVKDKQFEGIALYQLGVLAGEERDEEAARRALIESLDIRRDSGERDAESDTLVALARLENRVQQYERSRQFAERALETLESIRTQVATPALRASYYSRKRAVFDLLLDLVLSGKAAGRVEEGLLLVERTRARALLDLMAEHSMEVMPKPTSAERARIQRQINFLSVRLRRGDTNTGALRKQIQVLLAENDALDARIRATVRRADVVEPVTSFRDLQKIVTTDSALLEYHLGERQSYLWLVESKGPARVFSLPGRAVIESLAAQVGKRFDKILERRRSAEEQAAFEQALRKLSSAILGPLRGVKLPGHLIFALDGALHEIPLAALTRPGMTNPLGLTQEYRVTPSASLLAHLSPPRSVKEYPKTTLVLVDPVFSSMDGRVAATSRPSRDAGLNLPRLPFAAEVDTVKSIVPKDRLEVLRGFEASVESLSRKRLEDYAVLHLSTHTLIDDEEPQMSHIALSMVDSTGSTIGGLLRPQHLSGWKLQSSLIVLASCETALGKRVLGEGLAGFTSSLFSAGASQLVMSTSEVDAEASSEFFSNFYRSYLSAGSPGVERSLMMARRAMAASRRWADPYYWASFVSIGQGSSRR